MSKTLKKWTDVYSSDEEQRFFVALARHPKYSWRSVDAIAKEANLTEKKTEEIISKYYKMGIVIQNPKSETQWGYWAHPDNKNALPKDQGTIAENDKQKRIDKAN